MKGYQVITRSGVPADNASDGFDHCGPFAVEIARRLIHEGWGGGGGMRSDGGIVSIEFFIHEDHLANAIGMLREGMARHALNWLEPVVREIPDDAWFERLVRNKWLCAGCKGIEDFIQVYKKQTEIMEDWHAGGIHLAQGSDISNDYAIFVTEDMNVAIKHDFMLADCFGEDEDEELFQANEEAARQFLNELAKVLGKEPK